MALAVTSSQVMHVWRLKRSARVTLTHLPIVLAQPSATHSISFLFEMVVDPFRQLYGQSLFPELTSRGYAISQDA